jgi:integrase
MSTYMGESKAVRRFLLGYANVRTQKVYADLLYGYFEHLKSQGINLTPDELLEDNLIAYHRSDALDVCTKRKHSVWLEDYVNGPMKDKNAAETSRLMTASIVSKFYTRCGSPLFGEVQLARANTSEVHPPLISSDIRVVLPLLPLLSRVVCTLIWQTGCEVNRILALRWGDVDLNACPMKLQFAGRKRHRRPYHTYGGQDSVHLLRAWRAQYETSTVRQPEPNELLFTGKTHTGADPELIGKHLRDTAKRLASQGMIKVADPRSWHTHALRNAFVTEANSAGVRSELVEFFAGHISGIKWLYDRRAGVHEEELAAATSSRVAGNPFSLQAA